MKTVNNIFKHTFFCLALGTTVCSCDLDVEPTSSIATETFWTSEKDAWYNLNAVYSASIPGAAVHSDSYNPSLHTLLQLLYLYQMKHLSPESFSLQENMDCTYN